MGKPAVRRSIDRVGRTRVKHPARLRLRWLLSMIAVFIWISLLVMSGCVIKIGPGDGQGDPLPSGETGEVADAPAEPENPLEGADPEQVAFETLKASATAYLLQGYVQQAAELQGLDPDTIDETTLNQLIDSNLPAAITDADVWVSSLEPSSFVGQTQAPPAKCYEIGCPAITRCDSPFYQKKIACFLQACGDAKCPKCPQWFGWLASLYIRAWCSYVCYDNGQVVGSAALVLHRLTNKQDQICLLP